VRCGPITHAYEMRGRSDRTAAVRCHAIGLMCLTTVSVGSVACGRVGFVPQDRFGGTDVVDGGDVPDSGARCPAGANSLVDGGCRSVCGNGVTEAGEACDGGGRCNTRCELVFANSLVHRYSFDGTGTRVVDSVSGADGTMMGTSLNGSGTAVLSGGASGPYVDLPNGLISGLTDLTVELWLTWRGGPRLQRIFDFGMNSGGEGTNTGEKTSALNALPNNSEDHFSAFIDFTAATGDGSEAVVKDTSALAIGVLAHVAVTFSDSSNTFSLYRNGRRIDQIGTVTGHLSSIDDRNVWVGRANQQGIPALEATIHELRIYNVALTDAAISASASAGPDP
jgi:hypothetical protein